MSVLQVICFTLITLVGVAALIAFGRAIVWIIRALHQAGPAPARLTPVWRRLATTLRLAFSHSTFRGRPLVRLAHFLVMISFIFLLITLATATAQVARPSRLILGWGPANAVIELLAWGGLVAIVALIIVRLRAGGERPAPLGQDPQLRQRAGRPSSDAAGSLAPQRFFGSNRAAARFVEAVIAIVLVCILALHALTYAGALATGIEVSPSRFPFTFFLAAPLAGLSAAQLGTAILLVATAKILTSLVWLLVVGLQVTMGVAWHRFLAFLNLYAGRNADGAKSLGPLEPIMLTDPPRPLTSSEQLEQIEDPEQLAPTRAADLSWKRVTDLLSCTECGRCQEVCPAWASGKPLSPKLLVAAARDHFVAQANFVTALGPEATTADALQAAPGRWGRDLMPHSRDTLAALQHAQMSGPDGVPIEPADLVPEVISEDTLWACTTCGACVEACPVNIEILDHVIDLRRQQALLAAAYPADLRKPMKNLERRGNPYGLPAKKRLEWARDLDFEVPVIDPADPPQPGRYEYLFWVGCAGAFDDRGRKTSRAVATVLAHAQVSFAILGEAESCTGDPARRAGNEVLFLALAEANIAALQAAGVRKIVVSCAHCFNTIGREYPDFGGDFEVIHYTQLAATLIKEGRLQLREAAPTGPVVYHDACYLGRHNGEYAAPREILDHLGERVEMPRNRDRALCCGAGGARAFIEEDPGQRVASMRMAEAAATGAATVATACPFCTTMLNSVADTDAAAPSPKVIDVASLLAARLK